VPGSTPDFRLLWRLRRIPLAIKLAARDETNEQRKDPSRYIDEVWLKGPRPRLPRPSDVVQRSL
jgi:hypothetical protein